MPKVATKKKSPSKLKKSKPSTKSKFIEIPVPVVAEDRNMPEYKSDEAACADLVAVIPEGRVLVNHRTVVCIKTGVKAAVPIGYKLCLVLRSGHAKRGLIITNSPAQIDSDYRGEIEVIICNVGRELVEIKDGERFAQCYLAPVYRMVPQKANFLEPTTRGEGKMGSTGK